MDDCFGSESVIFSFTEDDKPKTECINDTKHELACLLADFHMNALADSSEFFTWDTVELKLHLCTSWRKLANSSGFQTFSKMVIF